VSLDNLEFSTRDYGAPRQEQRLRAALSTRAVLPEGQPMVLGVTSPVGSDRPLILVVRAEILPAS
jgi:hypothetical protein